MLNTYPRDFSLHKIGEFNDEEGTIVTTRPELIGTAESVLTKEAPNGNPEQP